MDKSQVTNITPPAAPVPQPQNNPVVLPPEQQPSKKHFLLFGGLGLVGIALVAGFMLLKPKAAPQAPKPKIQEPVNVVAVTDRPYVTLTPVSQGKHPVGTEIELTANNTTLGATEADYELEYQAGSLLQGAFGHLDFISEPPPTSKVLLLGTCSAGGKCDYNKDVVGGTLLLRLSGGSQKFAVKGEWSYQLMGERQGKFSSRDSKFRVDVGPKGLPNDAYVVVMQTMGLPKAVEGEVVTGPYYVTAGVSTAKSAEISWRLPDSATEVKLLGWTGSAWKEYKSKVADQTLTATVDQLTTFVVAK